MKKLSDYTQAEQNELDYAELCKLRAAAFIEQTEKMAVPDALEQWSRKMEYRALNSGVYDEWCEKNDIMPSDAEKARWAKTTGVHAHRIPHLAALMVVRYGEALDFWPDEFSEADIKRAQDWLDGKTPDAVINATKAGV